MSHIGTTEPSSVTAGDSVGWIKSLEDYRVSDGWTLAYKFVSPDSQISLISVGNGESHEVSADATTTSKWVPGTYTWQAYVTNGALRHTVAYGELEVKPNLAAQLLGYETRSRAKLILAQLEAAYQSYVSSAQSNVEEYEIAGRRMKFRSPGQIIQQIQFWRLEVAREENAQSVKDGMGNPRRIFVRFA